MISFTDGSAQEGERPQRRQDRGARRQRSQTQFKTKQVTTSFNSSELLTSLLEPFFP